MAQLATASAKSGAEAKVKDAIDNLRSAAQDLHKQITDAAAKKSSATRADIAALTEKAGSLVKSAKASIDTQQGNVAKHLTDAVEHLEATQANLSDSLKATGTALDTSVKKVLAEARASVEELSEAVAEKRAAGGLPNARLKRVLEFISAHLGDEIRLETLASIAGMSQHHFSDLFRCSIGVSPHQYVIGQRV